LKLDTDPTERLFSDQTLPLQSKEESNQESETPAPAIIFHPDNGPQKIKNFYTSSLRRRDGNRQTVSTNVEQGDVDLLPDDSHESNDDENKPPPTKKRKAETKIKSNLSKVASRKKTAVARKNPRTETRSSKQPLPKKGAKSKTKPAKGKEAATHNVIEKSYMDPDVPNILPDFTPRRVPGIYCSSSVTRNVQEIDFFQMFFTEELIQNIVKHTNKYAWKHIATKKSFAKVDGSWKETDGAEIKRFIALILYMGIVRLPRHDRYWSTKSLFHGLWAREILSRNRFFALLSLLHVVDPDEEDKDDKLKKISPFINYFRDRCRELFQPDRNLAIDERLVKSKHRSGIRQYIKNKPVKFGIKLWVIADSKTGYTCDFIVYAGSGDNIVHPEHGLGYGVVIRLVQPLIKDTIYTLTIFIPP